MKHGSAHVFDMHYTPPEEVLAAASAGGLSLLHKERDEAAGSGAESFVYVFQKSGRL
jgi:hypothetical protein